MDDSIASAVVLPDEPSPPPPAKRRQSSASEESSKRLRLEDGAKPKPAAAPARGERGRERRLFGSVFGALSRNQSTTAGQKRRAEIEKRQLAQRKQEDEESEQRKAERTARRKEQRWKEQRRFERESMQLRHNNLLHTAHFLKTKTEPHLYYKPWQTSEVEDDLIQRQIADAHESIKRELEEFNSQEEQRSNGDQRTPQDVDSRRNEQGAAIRQARQVEEQHSSARNGHANGDHQTPQDQEMEDAGASVAHHNSNDHTEAAMDDAAASNATTTDDRSKNDDDALAEEVIEEATEDTVIY